MAPEQARGAPIYQRADIYAFALILYDLLLGRNRGVAAHITACERFSIDGSPRPRRRRTRFIRRSPWRSAASSAAVSSQTPVPGIETTADLVADLERLDGDGNAIVRLLPKSMAAAAAVIVLLGLTWWLAQRPAATPVAHEPVSVLIADFTNAARDRTFEGAVEGALAIALEGAPFITSYSRTDARKIANDLVKRPLIDEAAARLVAAREGIAVILAGTISPDKGGYRITVRGERPDGGVLWTQQSTAPSRADVLGAVAEVASDIRSALGDTASRRERLADSESVTTSSLEALQSYTAAQESYWIGKFSDAVRLFQTSIAADATFGRAYAGLANALFYLGRKPEAEQNWNKGAVADGPDDRAREIPDAGHVFFAVAQNYEKAIDNYETLIKHYPTDSSGLNNLGVAYFMVLDFPRALEAGRRVLELYPKNVLFRSNYALYALYASDFASAQRESEPLLRNPGPNPFFKIYLPPAIAAAIDDQPAAAIAAYQSMAQAGTEGASLAATGLADLCDVPRSLHGRRNHPDQRNRSRHAVGQRLGPGGKADDACGGVDPDRPVRRSPSWRSKTR